MYSCKNCSSTNLRLEGKGTAIGLYCNDCNSWIKWVSKKELGQVKNEIEQNIKDTKEDKKLNFEYEQVGKRELYHTVQSQMIALDTDNTLSEQQKYTMLIQVINNIGDALKGVEESVGDTMKVFNSSEILTDIRLDSIEIQKYLIDKYGK